MLPFTIEVHFKDGVVNGKIDFFEAINSTTIDGLYKITPGLVFLEDGVQALTAITAATQHDGSREPSTFGAIVRETLDQAIAQYNDRGPKATADGKPGTAKQSACLIGDECFDPIRMLIGAGFTTATIKLSYGRGR